MGGLYPNGENTRPSAHNVSGLTIASQVVPLDGAGHPNPVTGKIVMIAVGMSNATEEFDTGGSGAFEPRADSDPSKNPKLVIVDGAQSGEDAPKWVDLDAGTWQVVNERLREAGVTPAQVEVAWLKQALIDPVNYGAFPAHALTLKEDLEIIVRNMKVLYPNIRIVYLTSRSRAYTNDPTAESPEPYAYESGFSVQWTIADQINGTGNLNFDPTKGAVVAPYLIWGPYIWTDGTTPRSDGFVWLCSDLQSDFIHPSSDGGVPKVADQLLAFFKTDPIATPWFLNQQFRGQPPTATATATPSSGTTNLNVQFSASGQDTGGTAVSYVWTFDDGTYSYLQNPVKLFTAPGTYNPHLIVADQDGDFVIKTVPVSVGTGHLLNVSTRLQVGTGDRVLIGGFIINGGGTKKLILRALGPSLSQSGVIGALADPTLELHDSIGATIATNDNWETTQIGGIITSDQVAEIQASTLAPPDPSESAIIATLDPGSYTAIVSGVNNTTGVGLVEVYDLDESSPAKLANISTRGFVQTGDNAMIGGFIVGTPDSPRVVVRALGPSLAGLGVIGALADPTLELHDSNGALIASNDNWADTQETEIEATGLAPTNPLESAIVWTVTPGNYTAIVTGEGGTVGIGLVEVYKIQ
jgi:PKD repeat protein